MVTTTDRWIVHTSLVFGVFWPTRGACKGCIVMTCRNWYSRSGCLALTLILVASLARAETETEEVSVLDELALAEPAPPPPPTRVQPAPRPASETSTPSYRRSLSPRVADRLAAAPRMFGDFYYNVGGDVFLNNLFGVTAQSDLPLAAGCRRMKACENNMAVPADRVYVTYNHFGGALRSEVAAPTPASQTFSVDRYTLAFEKTLCEGLWSIEMRMPFASDMEFVTPSLGVSGGRVGNLSVLAKRLLWDGECAALSAGLAIDVPTGSDAQVDLPSYPVPLRATLQNQAVHLMPFLALVGAPGRHALLPRVPPGRRPDQRQSDRLRDQPRVRLLRRAPGTDAAVCRCRGRGVAVPEPGRAVSDRIGRVGRIPLHRDAAGCRHRRARSRTDSNSGRWRTG